MEHPYRCPRMVRTTWLTMPSSIDGEGAERATIRRSAAVLVIGGQKPNQQLNAVDLVTLKVPRQPTERGSYRIRTKKGELSPGYSNFRLNRLAWSIVVELENSGA